MEDRAATRSTLEHLILLEDYLRYGVRSGREVPPEPEASAEEDDIQARALSEAAIRAGAPAPAPSSAPTSSAGAPSADRQSALNAIEARVKACSACVLSQTRSRTVFGQGVPAPEVLVIGEGPGAEEDRQGLPFVGASGKLLDKMLAAIGLSRETNCYIGNIVKCRPPNNREPVPTERNACIGYLRAQIEILRPRFILCVGRTAAHGLLEMTDPISRLRGRSFQFEGIPVRVTFHPSALLRDASLKRPVWEDLKQLRVLMDSPPGEGAASGGLVSFPDSANVPSGES